MALTPALNETEEGEWSFVLPSERKQRIKDGAHNSVKPKGRHIRKLVRTNFSRITNEVNFFLFIYLMRIIFILLVKLMVGYPFTSSGQG